jgi:hypothetical protein
VDPKILPLNLPDILPKTLNEPLAKLGVVLSDEGVPRDVNPMLRPADGETDPIVKTPTEKK